MKHFQNNLSVGYDELLSFCDCTRRLVKQNLLEDSDANQILSDLAEQMTPYESLFALLGIESPKQSQLNRTTLFKFVEIYSPEVIEQGYYESLEQIVFNQ